MRAKAGILLIMGLLLLVGIVAADLPDSSTGVTGSQWVIANGIDQANITVIASNLTSGVITGATVQFTINPIYGTVSPQTVMTDSSGKANSIFKVNKTSGVANITAKINSPDGLNVTIIILQNIDHNSAYYADFTHPLSGTVASQVPFNVSLTDQYRNPVDNRRGNHIISLHVHGPFPDDCGFAEAGFAHDISPTLDTNGNTSLNVKLTQTIGDNNVLMDGYQSIPLQLEWITAEARGAPVLITQSISPSGSPPSLPADGTSFFTIIYSLYDVYGNPTNGQYVWINTTVVGEEKQFLTNSLGQITYPYGPRNSIGSIYITAKSVAAPNVSSTPQNVVFTNTGAAIISLTATPDTMPSHDVPPSTFVSNIIATVADASGNAVPGETVTFIIENEIYEASYNVTAPPRLSNLSAITDVFGQAVVQFTPGNFTILGNPGFNASATGHCIVNATWNNTHKIIPITWKNYPYLSLTTSVNPPTVGINETIDVSIKVTGDGFLMQSKPVDVLLLIDNSGSMGLTANYNDGISQSQRAAITFIDQMTQGKDRVGVIFYDKNTYPSFSVYVPLTYALPSVKNNISSYTRTNAQGYHTRTRYALYEAITLMNLWNDRGASPVIIHMTDGQWSMEGDPLARGIGFNQTFSSSETSAGGLHSVWAGNVVGVADKYRYFDNIDGVNGVYGNITNVPNGQTYNNPPGTIGWASQPESFETTQNLTTKTSWYFTNAENTKQNMSVYAHDSGIKVFSIGFTPSANQPGLILVLQIMADANGGFYRYAPTETDLKNVYTEIAKAITDPPGVNTSMAVDFQYINVTGVTIPGAEVYNYVYNANASTKIGWQDGNTNVTDQTTDWQDQKLNFTIGTIKVGQQWNATFRLRVNQSGLIDVFGNQSTVSFNNGGPQKLILPQTFITVVPNLSVLNLTAKTITLKNLNVTATGAITTLLPVTWNATYTGNQTLTERVYYRIDTGPWILFDTKTHLYTPNSTMDYVEYAQLDVTKLPPGGYLIKVYATAPDAPDATIELVNSVYIGNRGMIYIKLQ